MKVKVYIPVFIATREATNPERGPYITTQHGDAFDSWDDANRWNAQRLEYSQTKETLEDGTIKVKLDAGILCVKQDIIETVIDTEDFTEYKPTYTVTMEVTKTWRFDVEIDGSEHTDVEDEYDAGQKAEELFNDGDYDDELDPAYVDDTQVDTDAMENF